jgi:hypothetical protein
MPEVISGARTFVTLPSPRPIPGGVMSVANVVDTSGHELMGAIAETDACATAQEWAEWCDMTPTGRKLFDSAPDFVTGDPFVVYAGVSCDLQRLPESKARAERRLAMVESRMVDLHIDAMLATDGDVVDLGGPMSLGEAIGVAEAFAATVYGGAPTLLVPRVVVPCGAAGTLHPNLDGTLATLAGSPVAPLTTPITVPVTAPVATLYVTGQITLLRSPVASFSVPQQIADDGTFEPMRALAERIYVPVFDCLVAKVEVTCS